MNISRTHQNQHSSEGADFWSAVSADKSEFRARVARAAAAGQGVRELNKNLALLGIDANRTERPKLVAINGVRLVRR